VTSILWLRRDLRRADHPALGAAAAGDGRVLPLFVLDPSLFGPAGPVRQAWLARTLRATADAYEGRLCVLAGDPVEVVPRLAREVGAASLHVSTETEPGGAARDARVAAALAASGIAFEATGSPYAGTPGRGLNQPGRPFQVFTPFARAWRAHGWRGPAVEPRGVRFVDHPGDPDAARALARSDAAADLPALPPAGEAAALDRWREFLDGPLARYATDRDRPDLDATSRLSAYLKFGVLHPRTLLADLAGRSGPGVERFVDELAWREFYADVLHHHPDTLEGDLRPLPLDYAPDDARVDAWRAGRTGFPFVDAGLRQLLATGWMHNRVRMVVASFLVKDLHVWWPVGARHFLDRLADGDLASNAHGWQWVAGTGTDAAPYFRVFNPVTQGLKFDPEGDYVRRWVPELAHLPGPAAHEPWKHPHGLAHGDPDRSGDHAAERQVALARYDATRGDG